MHVELYRMLYGLVLGTVISKITSAVLTRYFYRFCMYYFNVFKYRYKFNKLAKV